MNQQKTWLSLFIVFQIISTSFAQQLKFIEDNKSWNQVSKIIIGNGFKTKSTKGQGIYFTNTTNATLNSDLSLKQHIVKLEFAQSSNGKAVISLQENLSIILNADSKNYGTIELGNGKNILPNSYAKRAPGLWQTLRIIYNENGIEGMPTLELVELNGIKIHENIIILDTKIDKFHILNTSGEFAVQNATQKVYNNDKPLIINNLTYIKLKKTETDENFLNATSSKKGLALDIITVKLPGELKDSLLIFTGDILVDKDDNYNFISEYYGKSTLQIDEKLVSGSAEEFSRTPQTGQIFLKKGIHKFELKYQSSWRSLFGLLVAGTNFRPYIVSDPNSLPMAPTVGGVFIRKITGRPRVIRSFMMFDDRKRTAVISVGAPEGIHYSIDLEKANLLYAWKGEFADLTEMWHERGEPQTLMPLGLKIKLSGNNPLIALDEVKFESFVLDSEGKPSFNFSCSKGNFTQRFLPKSDALNVNINLNEFLADLLVAEGQNIEEVSKNMFKVDDYYVQVHNSAVAKIITFNNLKRIVIFNQKDLNYTLSW